MIGVLSPCTRMAKEKLATQRVFSSLASDVERSAIRKNSENWIVMWFDTGHAVSLDGGMTTAYRGIDTEGRLMWLVRHADKRYGYHSLERDPYAALEEAAAAWEARRVVKAEWQTVEQMHQICCGVAGALM